MITERYKEGLGDSILEEILMQVAEREIREGALLKPGGELEQKARKEQYPQDDGGG